LQKQNAVERYHGQQAALEAIRQKDRAVIAEQRAAGVIPATP
jgi:hypothetical protein